MHSTHPSVPCRAVPCRTVQCHVVPCRAAPRQAVLCCPDLSTPLGLQVHASACVPPKWRNPSNASYLNGGGGGRGNDPRAVLECAASVSVPENNQFVYSQQGRGWEGLRAPPFDQSAAAAVTSSDDVHMQKRSSSSNSLESVDIPHTG